MDESIDHYLSTSLRPDMKPVEESACEYDQQNVTKQHLASSCGKFASNEQAFPTDPMSNLTINCMPSQDALGRNIDMGIGSDVFSGGARLQNGIDNFNDNCLNRLHKGWIKDEHDVNLPTFDSYSYETLQLDASEEIPMIYDGPSLQSDKIGSIGNSIKTFDVAFGEILPQVYDGCSQPGVVEDNRMQAFSRGKDDVDNGNRNRFVNGDRYFPFNDFSPSISTEYRKILQSEGIPSLPTETTKAEKTAETGLPQVVLETAYAPSGVCKVREQPRVRARRGQATDPHSIAERLRREKISERMKSLQELVPNSCKTDKASMLDEIIEYVKFLQLQVKEMSISRLGAARTVDPLITEGSKKALVPFPSSLEGLEISPPSDQTALEKEFVKLMETDMIKAEQYLQSSGLCLMPIPLAVAIADSKARDRDKLACPVQNKSSSSNSSNNSLS